MRNTRFGLPLLVLAVGLCAGVAFASVRAALHYTVAMDETTVGGGPASSISFRETDSAVGQFCEVGVSSSASYGEETGVVRIGDAESGVGGKPACWVVY